MSDDQFALVSDLKTSNWPHGAAFKTIYGIILANDSAERHAPQEYMILRRNGENWHHVKTVTVSACTSDDLSLLIMQADAGMFDAFEPIRISENSRSSLRTTLTC